MALYWLSQTLELQILCAALIQYRFVEHPPCEREPVRAGKCSPYGYNIHGKRHTGAHTVILDQRSALCQAPCTSQHLTPSALTLTMTLKMSIVFTFSEIRKLKLRVVTSPRPQDSVTMTVEKPNTYSSTSWLPGI